MKRKDRLEVSAQEVMTFAQDLLGVKMFPQQVEVARAIIEGKTVELHSRRFGRRTACLVANRYLELAQGPEANGEQGNMLRDNYVIGVDMGAPGGDYTATSVFRTPGRLRKLLRRIGLDRSKWQFKLVRSDFTKHG